MRLIQRLLFIALIALPFFSFSQEIENILWAGVDNPSYRETLMDFIIDEQENYYLMIETRGDPIYIMGTAVDIPNSVFNDYVILAKVSPDQELLWYQVYDVPNDGFINQYPDKLTLDDQGNLYASINILNASVKIDHEGQEIFNIPIVGERLKINEENELELLGIVYVNTQVYDVSTNNRPGTVFIFDLDGNYKSHFIIDEVGWENERIFGSCDLGYFGLRRTSATSSNMHPLEFILYDKEGELIQNEFISYTNQMSMDVVYDDLNSRFYIAGFFLEREPFGSEDPVSFPEVKSLNIVQLNNDLEVTSRLILSGISTGNISYSNFSPLDLAIHNGDIYFSAVTIGSITHFGALFPIFAEEDKFLLTKLDQNLNYKWHRVFGEAYSSSSFTVSRYHEGKIYFGGDSSQSFTYENGTTTALGLYDTFFAIIADHESTTASTATGKVFIDANINGIDDDHYSLPHQRIETLPNFSINYTNSEGFYSTGLVEGTNEIKFNGNLPPFWDFSTDTTQTIEVDQNYVEVEHVDIGVFPIPGIRDVEVVASGITAVRPGFEALYQLNYTNNINDTLSGQITLVQDTNLNFLAASIPPDHIMGDTLLWNYDQLSPGESRSIVITDSLSANVDLLGDTIFTFVAITPVEGDTVKENNLDTLWQVVTGSYDPNDIQMFPTCVTSGFAEQGNFLEYTIRFQNLGSDTAFNVLVVDELPDSLNLGTLQFIDSSYPTSISFQNGALKFFFENIQLPHAAVNESGSHGFIRFKIKPYSNVERIDQIINKAAIYFDYNPPILTNEVFASSTDIVQETLVSCLPQTSSSGNQVWEITGTYLDTLPSLDPYCLQQVLVDYIRISAGNQVNIIENSLVYEIPGLIYQWFDCSTGEDIQGATSQDFQPARTGQYAVRVNTEDDCEIESSCISVNNDFGTDQDGDGFFEWADCNDNNPGINPQQLEEPYNGLDDDCNITTLDDDLDQDGFLLDDDCDDTNPNINDNQIEEPYNGLDDDCNPNTLDDDLDQDGFLLADDCDDTNPNINDNAEEIPNNGIDEDCDGEDLISSVHELANTTINIYPNPVIENINIEVIGELQYVVTIIDVNGRILGTYQDQKIIPMNSIPPGIYFLEIRALETDKKVIEKIVVGK